MLEQTSVLVVSKFRVSAEALSTYLGEAEGHSYRVTTSSCVSTHEIDAQPDVIILSCVDDCPAGADAIRALVPTARLIIISRSPSPDQQAEWLKKGVAGIIDEADEGFGLEQLSRAVAAVNAGEVWASRDLLARIVRNGHTRAEQGGSASLTPREHEILALLHLGLTNADIGRKLFISEKTVKAHLTNIYRKLGVANRVQATLKTRSFQESAGPPATGGSRASLPCASPLPIVDH